MKKIGFVVWNPFQIVQFEWVYSQFKHASTIIIMDRGANLKQFDFKKYKRNSLNYIVVKQKYFSKIDGVFDVIFFQSAFPQIEKFNSSKLVSLQYGLAKERHNYGEWRALADLNLMYGPYSSEKVGHFSPSFSVGNPKFECWKQKNTDSKYRNKIKKKVQIDDSKKTILYMPTWGELGSSDVLLEPLAVLQGKYNVIFKMHHNNDLRYAKWKDKAIELGITKIYDGSTDQLDLLILADLVISDFSGAIFDALLVKKPVVLFHGGIDNKIGVQKFDLNSLEYARRMEIGLVCESVEMLPTMIAHGLENANDVVSLSETLRKELFLNVNELSGSCNLIEHYINLLLAGVIPELTNEQRYVRETVQDLRKTKLALKKHQKKKTIFNVLNFNK